MLQLITEDATAADACYCSDLYCQIQLLCHRAHALVIRPPATLLSLLQQTARGAPTFVATQGAPPILDVLKESAAELDASLCQENCPVTDPLQSYKIIAS